jgi:hypothetical protein
MENPLSVEGSISNRPPTSSLNGYHVARDTYRNRLVYVIYQVPRECLFRRKFTPRRELFFYIQYVDLEGQFGVFVHRAVWPAKPFLLFLIRNNDEFGVSLDPTMINCSRSPCPLANIIRCCLCTIGRHSASVICDEDLSVSHKVEWICRLSLHLSMRLRSCNPDRTWSVFRVAVCCPVNTNRGTIHSSVAGLPC